MTKPRTLPWYDSLWLVNFVRAKDHIRAFHPDRLDEFIASFEVLRTDPDFETRHVRDIIAPADHARLVEHANEDRRSPREKHEIFTFGRLVTHNSPLCTEIQAKLTGRVSDLVGEEVEPSYNFLSLYTNLGQCPVHMDAPSAKWTFDYCIQQSAPWPIHLSQVVPWPEDYRPSGADWDTAIRTDPANRFTAFTLEEGEAIVFGGSSQWHYRNRIAHSADENFCHLAFFHYIPVGTAALADPARWADHFGLPGLKDVVTIPQPVDRSVLPVSPEVLREPG